MTTEYEWDDDKARTNAAKHNVTFDEAATVFADYFSLTIDDSFHSKEENRFVTIGTSHRQRLVVVVHTEREDKTRIISARMATANERRKYEQG